MLLKHRGLVAGVLVQADLADPQHAGPIQELGDHRDHLAGQRHVLGFLGVDAEPAQVGDPELRGPADLELGQLPEIIAKPLDARAIKPRPKRRLGHHHAPGQRHPLVVVGGAADHVDVRVDVFGHESTPDLTVVVWFPRAVPDLRTMRRGLRGLEIITQDRRRPPKVEVPRGASPRLHSANTQLDVDRKVGFGLPPPKLLSGRHDKSISPGFLGGFEATTPREERRPGSDILPRVGRELIAVDPGLLRCRHGATPPGISEVGSTGLRRSIASEIERVKSAWASGGRSPGRTGVGPSRRGRVPGSRRASTAWRTWAMAAVGGEVVAVARRGAVDPIERGGHLEQAASKLQEFAVQDRGHVARRLHGEAPSRGCSKNARQGIVANFDRGCNSPIPRRSARAARERAGPRGWGGPALGPIVARGEASRFSRWPRSAPAPRRSGAVAFSWRVGPASPRPE